MYLWYSLSGLISEDSMRCLSISPHDLQSRCALGMSNLFVSIVDLLLMVSSLVSGSRDSRSAILFNFRGW
ncbi:hypothetical protein A3Q56_08394 [Intoshia linei]|uniref:Uncharacterized protein n=1 Tax=Intoshia linei TaxID=1819745 RepID=A0A177ARA8_9BILA|nr:hypothetical protein A3Q56_08394 [Intoshia linei]